MRVFPKTDPQQLPLPSMQTAKDLLFGISIIAGIWLMAFGVLDAFCTPVSAATIEQTVVAQCQSLSVAADSDRGPAYCDVSL